ncbi:MAG: glutamate racemase [Syntrophomonadaceae bacterium]|nr:glutamate racemase [Syntrophomonadaceae bacterium]
MPFDNRPIGVFDSGIGGLTVARLIQEQLPGEDIIYIGDTAHLPYGEKSVSQLIEYARRIMDFLVKNRVKVIVAACNTSSSVSIDILRDRYPVPIIGVVKPGARAAVRVSKNLRIGVLATEATVKSSAYRREILSIEENARVWEIPCPLLVPAVEQGRTADPEIKEAIASYLDLPLQNQADTIVLGCTHYPYLQSVIAEVCGEQVSIVDPALETVAELKKVLSDMQGYARRESGRASFFATGTTCSFTEIGARFYGRDLGRVETVDI